MGATLGDKESLYLIMNHQIFKKQRNFVQQPYQEDYEIHLNQVGSV